MSYMPPTHNPEDFDSTLNYLHRLADAVFAACDQLRLTPHDKPFEVT